MLIHWNSWRRAFSRSILSGSVASALSAIALLILGRREAGSAVAPVNAVSHWYFGDKAARRDRPSLKYTLSGYLTHHAASVFWATIFERLFERRTWPTRKPPLSPAAAIALTAAVVDYTITPKRLTPGFEKRLPATSLVWVYGAFAIGLALGHSGRSLLR